MIDRNVAREGTKDDCIAIKSVEYDWGVNSVGHDVRDIMVKNSVLWNGVWGSVRAKPSGKASGLAAAKARLIRTNPANNSTILPERPSEHLRSSIVCDPVRSVPPADAQTQKQTG